MTLHYSGRALVTQRGLLWELLGQIGPDSASSRQWQSLNETGAPGLATSFQTPETQVEAESNRLH